MHSTFRKVERVKKNSLDFTKIFALLLLFTFFCIYTKPFSGDYRKGRGFFCIFKKEPLLFDMWKRELPTSTFGIFIYVPTKSLRFNVSPLNLGQKGYIYKWQYRLFYHSTQKVLLREQQKQMNIANRKKPTQKFQW